MPCRSVKAINMTNLPNFSIKPKIAVVENTHPSEISNKKSFKKKQQMVFEEIKPLSKLLQGN